MQQWVVGIEPWGRMYFEEQGFEVTDQIVLRNLVVYIDRDREVIFPVVERDLMRERVILAFKAIKNIDHKVKYKEVMGTTTLQKSWLVIETEQHTYKYMIAIEGNQTMQPLIKSEGEFGISKLKAYVGGKILYGKRDQKMQVTAIPVQNHVKGPIVLTKKKETIQNGMWLLYGGLAALLFSLMNIGFWGWGEQTKLVVMILGSFGILSTAWGAKWLLLTPMEKYVVTEKSIRKYGVMSLKIVRYRELKMIAQKTPEVAVFSKGVLRIHTNDEILIISQKNYELAEMMRFIQAFEAYSKLKVIIKD